MTKVLEIDHCAHCRFSKDVENWGGSSIGLRCVHIERPKGEEVIYVYPHTVKDIPGWCPLPDAVKGE